MKKMIYSQIKKYFTPNVLLRLEELTRDYSLSNNAKSSLIMDILKENNIPATPLGSGTNRYGIMIDGYAIKVALDRMGKIDNQREFKYSKQLQPYVLKVYECTHDGVIAVSEYINAFSEINDFYEYQEDMRDILSVVSKYYLIGDVGVTTNNYMNWGLRFDGSLVMMDFAYIYALSYKTFECNCEAGSQLEYDNDYVNLICPSCHRKYSFKDIRKRVTQADELAEIGDIREVGYNVTEPIQEVEVIARISDQIDISTHKKEKKSKEKIHVPEPEEPMDYDLTPEEQMQMLRNNRYGGDQDEEEETYSETY